MKLKVYDQRKTPHATNMSEIPVSNRGSNCILYILSLDRRDVFFYHTSNLQTTADCERVRGENSTSHFESYGINYETDIHTLLKKKEFRNLIALLNAIIRL